MRLVYIALGLIFSGLGALGLLLPVLPTTPFLLLGFACFSKGSLRFQNWFMATHLYKNHVEEFIQDKSMTANKKAFILLFASLMLLIPFIMVDSYLVKFVIGIVYITKYYYFLFVIKTIEVKETL